MLNGAVWLQFKQVMDGPRIPGRWDGKMHAGSGPGNIRFAMKILAVDTATRSCSVALTEDDRLLAEFTLVRRQTHSRHLAVLIDHLLQQCDLKPDAVDGFAVTHGPGSFTGLRIGLSTVKGMAEAIGRPMAGVSTLAALAMQVGPCPQPVCPIIDARRKEVYVGGYRFENGLPTAEFDERAVRPESVPLLFSEPCIYIGDGALLYRDRLLRPGRSDVVLAPDAAHVLRAGTVAALAWHQFRAGRGQDPGDFVPVYLRKSDAERNRHRNTIGKISNIH